ncbi:AAA domain-containing protein, putative AbiEii toxin, Type IV TA system [Methylomagnum ishizawai]|uniref:AAA domain-containing protein, putative AbiEii toxin, Type IV TA system n=1 Tax=Methylomagnum ishizawai TaxID=1760988 RepID=A0A1Y6D2F5_9GAMM|nr:AAA domain-containing protein, putative AbiEii toxin, Type IV TA system [Methylomagnum ishizawai]
MPSWRFRIANLGCVESGELEVKPLTLLCGPNNTGKTWVMYALYGFLKYSIPPNPPIFPGLEFIFEGLKHKKVISWDLEAWVRKYADELIELINANTRQRFSGIFHSGDEFFYGSRFDWGVNAEAFVKYAVRTRLDFEHSGVVLFKPSNNGVAKLAIDGDRAIDFLIYPTLSAALLGFLSGVVSGGNRFLIPTERNGLNLFFRELVGLRTALLHPSSRGSGSFLKYIENLSNYPEPIADYINWLSWAGLWEIDAENRGGKIFEVAERVKMVAGGRYAKDGEGNVCFMPSLTDSAPKLALHLASSTVNSLFPLWFYLEHQAKPGDVLMIDEPELNLHPANQRAVARLLARLVNAGIRVVCSTHSDYIVREINSLIMLARPHPQRAALMQRFGYEEEEILRPEQVGAYVFENGHIAAMPITEDEGISAQTFDQQIHELNETSDEIYYTYRDNGGEAAGG